MTHQTNTTPENDFPAGLSQPALRALSAAGYTRLDQFTGVTEAEVLALHGVGPKAINLIRSALAARGLAFAERDRFQTGVEPSGGSERNEPTWFDPAEALTPRQVLNQ